MSFWGATVITNLISAIPYIGTDIVEWVWGGLNYEPHYGDIMFKILLNAGNSPLFEFAYVFFFSLDFAVKIALTWRQSAGVSRSLSTSKASQRLHAGDLIYAYIVGIFEGVGWFKIKNNGGPLVHQFGIELPLNDVQLIYKIKALLGVGVVRFRQIGSIQYVSLLIQDKDHLIQFIFPIFDKFPMFSYKQLQYLSFKSCLLSYSAFPSPEAPSHPTCLPPYFSAWLVGYIETNGQFLIDPSSLVASFEIKENVLNEEGHTFQGDAAPPQGCLPLLLSFFGCEPQGKEERWKVVNVREIGKIIKFLKRNPMKLLGHKRLQFLLWLKRLRKLEKYSNGLDIPTNY